MKPTEPINAVKTEPMPAIDNAQALALAQSNGERKANELSGPRLFLDVTATQSSPLKTGIQRVTLELFKWIVRLHPDPTCVVPVTLKESQGQFSHVRARPFERQVLGTEDDSVDHEPIKLSANDTLLHLDLATTAVHQAYLQGLYSGYQAQGSRVYSLVYDLLPIRLPDCFAPDMAQHHRDWLKAVASFDGALCISRDVAQDLMQWYLENQIDVSQLRIDTFKLGADIGTFNGPPSTKKPSQPPKLRRFGLARAKTFLMVGTIEPRKGYGAVLDAFDALWRDDCDHRLIIVGREGWTHLPDQWRASIIAVRDRMDHHTERFRKLVWMSCADDDQLALAYRQADCLIAASYGEGFGLPIIESYQRGVPVLARDIAVFREVAPAGTVFFRQDNLAQSIAQWQPPITKPNAVNNKNNINDTTWQDSARMVMDWLGQPLEPEQSLPVLRASHTDTDLSQHG